MKDYSHIVGFEYGSTAYDWSLLPNSKFVLDCVYKEGFFKTEKRLVRMYDADVVTHPNGIVAPKGSKAKLLLRGKLPKDGTIPYENLVQLVYHFREDKPFDTEQFVKDFYLDVGTGV